MSKQEINEAFINDLCQTTSIMIWTFDNIGQTEIVPKELTHHYLLENFEIDHSIYKFYHLPTRYVLSASKLQKMKDCGLLDKDGLGLWPYSNIIYGASHSRVALSLKLHQATFSSPSRIKLNGKRIKYFEDLLPYFKEYANGFADGFNEFDNKQIKPFLIMFADKQDYVNKVFEYITKKVDFDYNWASNKVFTRNGNNEIVDAFEDGQKQGFFYRAWSFVFSNNNLFAPLFQEHFKTLPPQQIEKPKPELKIDQIALKYAYEGLQITRENGNDIAKQYGHNSGEKLFQRFTFYSSSTNRKGKPTPCTPKKLDNKIKLIESVIDLLPTDKQARAKDEVSILKKIYEADY
jgi:hypothetical protein